MQGTQVLTQYLNDQLKEDMKRDELVMKGKLSRVAADAEADEWAEVSHVLLPALESVRDQRDTI